MTDLFFQVVAVSEDSTHIYLVKKCCVESWTIERPFKLGTGAGIPKEGTQPDLRCAAGPPVRSIGGNVRCSREKAAVLVTVVRT